MWVDQQETPMVPADKWPGLSYNQMLDTKNQLLNKLSMARGNPAYTKPIGEALKRIEVLLAAKLNDPRGLS